MKGYKVFDKNWKCRGFQYEIGETYEHDGEIGLCDAGFHFCENVADCFNYYSFDSENKIAIVEAIGKIEKGDDKCVTNKLRIIQELSWPEMLAIVNMGEDNSGLRNSGDWNSGDWNSGDWNSGGWNSGGWNSGDRNSGDRNSGDWNSGDWNSGDWNSCDNETGHFNSTQSDTIRIFNQDCNRLDWKNAIKPNFIFFNLTIWITSNDMTNEEKKRHPAHETTGGYLKTLKYKEAWRIAYESATSEDIELLKALPNFDADVFEEISGIRIED